MTDEKWMKKTTVCTPTYYLTRSSASASGILGWIVFILFIMAVVMIFLGILSVFGAGYTHFVRNLLLLSLCFALYMCIICLFLIDILSSIDASLQRIVKSSEKTEETVYNQFLLSTKQSKTEKK